MKESKIVKVINSDKDNFDLDNQLKRYTIFNWQVVSTSSQRIKLADSNYIGKFKINDSEWGDEVTIVLNRDSNVHKYTELKVLEDEFNKIWEERQRFLDLGAYVYMDDDADEGATLEMRKFLRAIVIFFTYGLAWFFYYKNHPIKSISKKEYEINKAKADKRIKELNDQLDEITSKALELHVVDVTNVE